MGKKDETPRRTGAFTSLGRYVGFVVGAGEDATLGLIDAANAKPAIIQLPLQMADGNRPAGLTMAVTRGGKAQAFVFHDHAVDVEAPNQLSVIELDPDGDKDLSDAKVAYTIAVGRSMVEGHSGHHSLDFDADHRRGILTNPGDGTLAVLSLADKKIEAEFQIGKGASSVICVGGRQEAGD